jgi:hypothetical protein
MAAARFSQIEIVATVRRWPTGCRSFALRSLDDAALFAVASM